MNTRAFPVPPFLEARIAARPPVRVARAIVAYSGGLDSLLCAALMQQVYGCPEVCPVLGDIGQGHEVIRTAQERLASAGLPPAQVLDLQGDFQREWLPRAIRANASYRGYPIAAPMIKQILGRRLGERARAEGADAVVEGATGVGNDQFRFAISLASFAPEVRQVSPIRELELTRAEEIHLCDLWGLAYDPQLAQGGDDVTPWCRSIASGAFGAQDALDERHFLWWRAGGDGSDAVELAFEGGLPVAVDGAALPLQQMLEALNPRLGARGIGLIDIVEDSRVGLKGREIYEAPAATAILRAKGELEALCLTREELAAKVDWERLWLDFVYRGEGYHPLVAALDAAIAKVQERVTGVVALSASGGGLRVLSRRSPRSLLRSGPRLQEDQAALSEACRGMLTLERMRHRLIRDACGK